MLWNDLREFTDRLEQLGELKTVRGADWEKGIGALSELVIERGGPALLFDEIPGYPKGYRVLANAYMTPKRMGIALGLDHTKPLFEMAEEWERVSKGCEPLPTEMLASGPVMQNVLEGDAVDLLSFPSPRWHDGDGGRYIGTGLCVIQKDPDSGFVNSGSYRVALHDRTTCTIFMEPDRHGDLIRRKHWKRGERAPVVITVGQEPILTNISGGAMYHCADGVSELGVAGYFHRSPYPVIPSPISGIPIPATAEIAIEGFMPAPEERLEPEGPFGEWTGYYAHGRRLETVVEVAAIYHRDDPIIFGMPPTRPIRAYRELSDVDLNAKRRLLAAGLRGIAGVFILARPNMRVVAINQMYEEHVSDVIRVLEPGGHHLMGNHIWILVDDDVDVSNPREVLWAIASRCAPEHGVLVVPGTADWQLDPRIPPEARSDPGKERGRQPYSAHNLVINACRPYQWIDEFPRVNVNGADLRRQTEQKYQDLLADI